MPVCSRSGWACNHGSPPDTRTSRHRSKAEIACSSFAFDTVLGAGASQADLYRAAVAPVVEDVLNGYNGTIMAYGCTGAAPPGRLVPDEFHRFRLDSFVTVSRCCGPNNYAKPARGKLSPALIPWPGCGPAVVAASR